MVFMEILSHLEGILYVPLLLSLIVPFCMAVGNVELMHEYFPKQSSMGTAKNK